MNSEMTDLENKQLWNSHGRYIFPKWFRKTYRRLSSVIEHWLEQLDGEEEVGCATIDIFILDVWRNCLQNMDEKNLTDSALKG